MAGDQQVILIGLDGIGDSEISEWLADCTLPNLSSLSENGTYCDLISTHPPWTPCAWPSLLSGRNPGKHGVFDFFTSNGYDKNLIDRSDVDSLYLNEAVDSNEMVPLIINYPVTHPTTNLNEGAIIPGYLATEDVDFFPLEIRSEFEDKYGSYRIYPNYGSDDDEVEEYIDVARCRRDMARFLDERYNWDLMAVQFQVTDSIFHDLDNRFMIREILKEIDSFVDDIIDLGDKDTRVFIVSDHGMGNYEWTFYINSWLADNGYCETTEGDVEYFRQEKSKLKGDVNNDSKSSNLGSSVKVVSDILTQIGFSPQKIHRGLSKIGLAETVERLLPEEALIAAQNQVVDHENSKAFQLYFNSLGIHLNVKGRDPEGIIPKHEYDNEREELMTKLRKVRDPDGNLVFDEVKPREAVYSGKHLEDAPDILLVPRDYQYDVSGSILDTFRRNPHKNHKSEGILISDHSLGNIDQAKIYDIAPTIAAALGIPVDSNTDGTVLPGFEETVERKDWDELAGNYINQKSDNDTRSVEDRLADLGYME
ncbi:alkaline phosphatase family protein [Haladaptatus sp. NG-SE-30]